MADALMNADQDLITDTRREAWEQGRQAAAAIPTAAAAQLRATFGPRGGNAVDRHTAEQFDRMTKTIRAMVNPY